MHKKPALLFSSLLFFLGVSTVANAQIENHSPVVIVPGIAASMNQSVIFNPFSSPTIEGWRFTASVKQYNKLIEALEDKGLVSNQDFFIAFYDWRKSSVDSARDYLVPIIDKALVHSTTGKVDIVAHSMGGLVARAYIQSDTYRDDVDQLVLLGTPNSGSSDVYTLWEGALVPSNWDSGTKSFITFTTRVLQARSFSATKYDTIHLYTPSVGELLPTYDFLHDKVVDTLVANDSMQEQNLFLRTLNLPSGLQLLTARVPGGILAIAGEGEATVGTIPVLPYDEARDGSLWKDGKPDPLTPVRDATDGDNRVLLASAFLPDTPPPPCCAEARAQPSGLFALLKLLIPFAEAQIAPPPAPPLQQSAIASKHGDLPTLAIPQVFEALGLGAPALAYAPIPEPDVLMIGVASPVELAVTTPSGDVIAKDSTTPGAHFESESDPLGAKLVIIENPAPGSYAVELQGIGDGAYHFSAGSFTDTGDSFVETEGTARNGEAIGYTVTYAPGSEDETTVSDPVALEFSLEELLALLKAKIAGLSIKDALKKQLLKKIAVLEKKLAHAKAKPRVLAKLEKRISRFITDIERRIGKAEKKGILADAEAKDILALLERIERAL